MKKALRKLVPAIVMLLIAAAFVGTSTYAWFSMNSVVTVNGMSVTTKVEDSLLIAESNAEANYQTSLTQTRTGKLRPVSTVNGVSFFYSATTNVTGNGSARNVSYTAYSEAATADPSNALAPENTGKTNYDAAFQTAYGVTGTITGDNVIYGYMDYTFYIKATNVTNGTEDLKLTTLNLLYDGAALSGGEKAWRVAVFAQSATAGVATTDALVAGDCKAILAPSGSANFTQTEDVTPLPKAASATNATAGVTYASADWYLAQLTSGATAYYKVTVRLWLEGEDSTCNNETFAALKNNYTLNIAFALGGSAPAVTVIGSTAA